MNKKIVLILCVLVLVSMANSQESKKAHQTPKITVYVVHTGADAIGSQFVRSVEKELRQSNTYALGVPNASAYDRDLRFYVDVVTTEIPGARSGVKSSAVSIVVEEMGLPKSFPVPFKWYHKVVILDPVDAESVAAQFISDMNAHWCRTIKNSVGGCPSELLAPVTSD